MKTRYLEAWEVLEIHDIVIERSGGVSGILSFGNLDFVMSKSRIPRRFERKVVTLLVGLVHEHPFVDGNKRTGYIVMKEFLFMNGRKMTARERDIWEALHKISKGEHKASEVSKWILENMTIRSGRK